MARGPDHEFDSKQLPAFLNMFTKVTSTIVWFTLTMQKVETVVVRWPYCFPSRYTSTGRKDGLTCNTASYAFSVL